MEALGSSGAYCVFRRFRPLVPTKAATGDGAKRRWGLRVDDSGRLGYVEGWYWRVTSVGSSSGDRSTDGLCFCLMVVAASAGAPVASGPRGSGGGGSRRAVRVGGERRHPRPTVNSWGCCGSC